MRFSTGQIISLALGAVFGVVVLGVLFFAVYATCRAHREDLEANRAVLGRWQEVGQVTIRHIPTPVGRVQQDRQKSQKSHHHQQQQQQQQQQQTSARNRPLSRNDLPVRQNTSMGVESRRGVKEEVGGAGIGRVSDGGVKKPDKVYNPYKFQPPSQTLHHHFPSQSSSASLPAKRTRDVSPNPRVAVSVQNRNIDKSQPIPPKDTRQRGETRPGIRRGDSKRVKEDQRGRRRVEEAPRGKGSKRDRARERERERERDRDRGRSSKRR